MLLFVPSSGVSEHSLDIALLSRPEFEGPTQRMMTGDNLKLKYLLYGLEFGAARVAGKIMVVSPYDSDVILATAVWFGPGVNMLDSYVFM